MDQEQGINNIKLYIDHIGSDTVVGKFLRILLDKSQVEVRKYTPIHVVIL